MPKQSAGELCSAGNSCGRRPHLVSRGGEFLPHNLIRGSATNISNNNYHCCNNNIISVASQHTNTATSTVTTEASTANHSQSVGLSRRSSHKNNK